MASSIKISRHVRRAIYAVLMASWISGTIFFILNQWVEIEGEFGPQKHPMQAVFLKIHGAAAFLMMVAYGALLTTHVPESWRVNRMRRVGLALVISQGFLIVTAYLLYYVGGDTFRTFLGYAHASVGFSFPFLLITHIFQGSQRKKRGHLKKVVTSKAA